MTDENSTPIIPFWPHVLPLPNKASHQSPTQLDYPNRLLTNGETIGPGDRVTDDRLTVLAIHSAPLDLGFLSPVSPEHQAAEGEKCP